MGKGCKNRVFVDIMATHPEVTGSSILCIVKYATGETIKFVVDCGLFQEQEYNDLNESLPFNAKELDFILVTHNHVDHTGRLPFVVKSGYRNPIYTTEGTLKLIGPALGDSCGVLHDLAKRNNKKPLYEANDVENTLELIEGLPFRKTIEVVPNVKVTFFENGHLVGASLILVQISSLYSEDINILFTGDYNSKNMFFSVPELPKWVLDLPLTVIQESTYGNINSDEVKECFKENIIEGISLNKNILIPVFSLGRSQEIAFLLKKMQDDGSLPMSLPIYLDGPLTQKYTNIYLHYDIGIEHHMKDFLPKNFHYVKNENRYELLSDNEPKIVLTSSGMGSYGPAQMHIPHVISQKNGLIHFTGYMAEGTLGRRLKETKTGETVSVGGLLVRKLGEVKYTNELSAHAKADEMIEFLSKFNHLKLVLLNHGEQKTKNVFASRILKELNPKNIGILDRDYFFRINSFGLVKTMGTKFC